jgi:hypothetical protein
MVTEQLAVQNEAAYTVGRWRQSAYLQRSGQGYDLSSQLSSLAFSSALETPLAQYGH